MAADGEGAEECHEDDEQQQVDWQAGEQAWQMAADGEGARFGTVGPRWADGDGHLQFTASSYHVHADSAGYVLECVVEIYSRWIISMKR